MAQPKVLLGLGYSLCRWSAGLCMVPLWRGRYGAIVAADGRRCGLYRLSGKADSPATQRCARVARATREPFARPSTSQMRWPAAISRSMSMPVSMPVSMPRPLSR